MLDWVSFRGTNPRGERRRSRLDQFVELLTTRTRAPSKSLAPGFSATRYKPEYVAEAHASDGKIIKFTVTAPSVYRNKSGVESLSAWVGDVDHHEPDWQRLASTGNLIVCYTTWSHDPDTNPSWRLVVPFAGPVAVEDWPAVYAAAVERFEPHCDLACRSEAQFYWLHAGPVGTAHLARTRVFDGELWAPGGLDLAPARTATVGTLRTADPDREATASEQVSAQRMLEATCRKLAQHDPGGRQVAVYGHARYVGHLVAAGALDEQLARETLWQAAEGNGVAAEREAETRRALERGLAKGAAEGAYDFDGPQRIRVVRVG